MSWDFEVGPAGYRHELFERNVTFNNSEILRLAGFNPDILNGVEVARLRVHVRFVLRVLQENPAYFSQFSPTNGWGGYSSAVTFIRDLSAFLEEAPNDYVLKVI